MNAHSGRTWRDAAILIAGILVVGAILFAAAGQPQQPAPAPLQSPLQSPIQPTPPPVATPTAPLPPPPTVPAGPPPIAPTTATPLFVPTVERTPIFLPTPLGTPDIRSTSDAVIATLTAQAIPPTVPVVTRRPIGAGPDQAVQMPRAPTPLPDPSGITLLSLSDRVYAGGAIALTIRTKPDAVCNLQIARAQADGGQRLAPVSGGASRRAGSDGVVAWIWAVDANEPAGLATLLVSCDAIGTVQYQIEVAR
ncbi:MAG: hypothetical protein KatS3mg053_3885 [Candidatus Roseilinea sp.]|nr:MAG: hypothetical protein KatS3mg053_3885 [Candidatus Roseilinea sp.]